MDNLLLRPNRVDPYDAAFFMGNQDWGQRRSIRAPEWERRTQDQGERCTEHSHREPGFYVCGILPVRFYFIQLKEGSSSQKGECGSKKKVILLVPSTISHQKAPRSKGLGWLLFITVRGAENDVPFHNAQGGVWRHAEGVPPKREHGGTCRGGPKLHRTAAAPVSIK